MKNQIVTQRALGASRPIRVNGEQTMSNFKLGLFTRVSSGAELTYSVEYCYQEPEGAPFAANPDWRVVTDISTATGDDAALWDIPIQMVRLNVTAFTGGSVTLTVTQTY